MRPSKRLERIPPYAFAQLERKIADKRAAGVDVISLGIGDPDTPDAAADRGGDAARPSPSPSTHRYPSNRGRAEFREAVATFYARRFDVTLDPENRGDPGDRRQGGDLQPQPGVPGPRRRTRSPPTPAIRSTPAGRWLAGAEPVLMALEPELGFAPDLDAIDADVARRGAADVPQLPEQPDRGGRARRASSSGSSSSPASTTSSSSTTTPTARRPSTATRPLVPGDARAPGRSASRCSRCPRATT